MSKHSAMIRKPLAALLALAMAMTMWQFAGAAVSSGEPASQWIQVYKTMLEKAGEEPADNKFKLFDEFNAMRAYPPDGAAGNIAKPDVNSTINSNPNVWRTPGAAFYDAGNNVTRIKFGETSQYIIEKVWVFDGPMYAPSTYTADGSAPYEVMGGKIAVWSYDGSVKLGEVTASNSGSWLCIDLTGLSGGGYTANSLRFVKTSDSVKGTPSAYSWRNEVYGPYSMEYYCDADIAEVMLYGKKVAGSGDDYNDETWNLEDMKVPEGTPVTGGVGLNFGQFVGTNSFFTENQATYEILGNVREYHSWGWTEWTANDREYGGVKDNSITSMNPHATFIDGWGFDSYYKNMHERGVDVTICVQGGALGYASRPSYQDPDGMSSTQASSYLGHGQSMFQLAARYGSNTNIDPSLVRVHSSTSKQIGLGYVEFYEDFNEPNLGAFSGAQFAAMMSADYDGHMGTLGPDVGVKQADPNAKLVMGGLAGIIYNTNYNNGDWTHVQFIADMMKWFNTNRTLEQWKNAHNGSEEGYVKYPFDVLNGHYYCPDGVASTGRSPEADHIFERMNDFVQFRNDYFPDKEIWLSEFGWDSAQGSSQSATVSATVNAGLTGPEVQGRWLVREYLMLAAVGVNRVQQFMMPDTSNDPNNPGRFATCGMIYGIQGSASFKPSWYYVGTMRNVLKDMSLDDVEIIDDGGWEASGGGLGDVETSGPIALKFNSTQNEDIAYALWLPTSLGDQNGANTRNYTIHLPVNYEYATLVTLENGVKWGVRTDISDRIADGELTVAIGEKPVFVIAGTDEYYNPISGMIDAHNFTFDTLTPNSGDPSKLFDEFRMDTSSNPAPNEGSAWAPGDRDRYAIIDLGARYNLDTVYAWDASNTLLGGNVFAVHAYTGEGAPAYASGTMNAAQVRAMLAGNDWERICWYDFGEWMTWVAKTVGVTARYLVVGIEDGPSTIPKDQWNGPYLPIVEMMLKGSLAQGETPPDPWERTFEPKPSYEENLFLFDNDFDGVFDDAYNTNGGNFSVIEGKNADGTEGRILKVTGTSGAPELTIPASFLTSMEHDKWYFVDYKLKLEDTNSAPVLFLLNTYAPIYNNSGGGNQFKPIWSPDSGRVAVVPNEWHQLKARFKIDSGDYVAYEVFYDGRSIGAATTNMQQALPLGGLQLRMVADPGTGRSTYYYDDLWVYTPLPKSALLNASFDTLAVNKIFVNGDEGLAVDTDNSYVRSSTIVQPASSSGAYLGAGDRLLKVVNDGYLFKTNTAQVLEEMKTGEDYVFEFSFYTSASPSSPTIQFLYDGWMRQAVSDTNWWGGMGVVGPGQSDWAANITPEANKWHRIAIQYSFESATVINYKYYYDNALITTVRRDSAAVSPDPDRMGYQTNNFMRTMGFLIGTTQRDVDMNASPLYLNDVMIYRGDIKPWPAKYSSEPVMTYAVAVQSAGTGASGAGQYAEGETVYIAAGTAPAGKVFSNWSTNDGVSFADANSASTSFVMPGRAVTVTANFIDDTAPQYDVTVSSAGSGAAGSGRYHEGATVYISAGTAPAGKHFVNWASADGVSFANASSPSTSFAMPAKAVTVTAVFADDAPLSDKIPWAGFTFHALSGSQPIAGAADMFRLNDEFDPKLGVKTGTSYPNWAVPYFDQWGTDRYTIIDLGKYYEINEIDLMIKAWNANKGALKIYYGEPDGWNPEGSYSAAQMAGFMSSWSLAVDGLNPPYFTDSWHPSFTYGVPIVARYLVITTASPGENVAIQQMVLYGKEYKDPTILRGTFDTLTVGAQLANGDEQLGSRYPSNGYAPGFIVQPAPSDAFYLGEGDQLLEATKTGWLFNTFGQSVLSRIELQTDYVFDFYFFADNAGALPAIRALYNTWNNFQLTGFWGGQLHVIKSDGDWVRLSVSAGEWHRMTMLYSFPSENTLSFTFYLDGEVIAETTLDFAIGGGGPVDSGNRVNNLRSTMGFEVRVDTNNIPDDTYHAYINDVYIYQSGEIRPWDGKYNALPVPELDKSALEEAIQAAEALNSGDYTSASWAVLERALNTARAAFTDITEYSEANQLAIDEAASNLLAAIAHLQTPTLICSVKSMLAKVAKLQQIPVTWNGTGALRFSTSNAAVCGVTQDGTLIPMKAGIAVITITAPNGANVIFAVTVSV